MICFKVEKLILSRPSVLWKKSTEEAQKRVTTSHLPELNSSFLFYSNSLTSYCSVKCFLLSLILSYKFQVILPSNSFLNGVCISSLFGIIFKLPKTETDFQIWQLTRPFLACSFQIAPCKFHPTHTCSFRNMSTWTGRAI